MLTKKTLAYIFILFMCILSSYIPYFSPIVIVIISIIYYQDISKKNKLIKDL